MKSNRKKSKMGAKPFYRPDGDNVKLPFELWRAPQYPSEPIGSGGSLSGLTPRLVTFCRGPTLPG